MTLKEKRDDPEYIKSGYLFNLTKFIHWPQNTFNFSVSPFIIGVFGDYSINIALVDTLREKKIKDRDWKVEFYKNPKEIRYCHLVFLTGVAFDAAKALINSVKHKTLLTLGDNIDGFCDIGGMINLIGNSPNYGYEINVKALNHAHLNVTPEFLELATLIE